MQLYGQLNPGKPVPSFPKLLSDMVKRDGITSVYKGVDAAIGRQMVYGTARIGLHRMFSDQLVYMNGGGMAGKAGAAFSAANARPAPTDAWGSFDRDRFGGFRRPPLSYGAAGGRGAGRGPVVSRPCGRWDSISSRGRLWSRPRADPHGSDGADFGFVPAKLWADVRLGLVAALAVVGPIQLLQVLLQTFVMPKEVAADPLSIFVFAAVLGTLYCRTHRIVPGITLHVALNLTSLTLAWLAVGT